MLNWKRKKNYNGKNKNYSIINKLRREKKSTEEFEIMLNNIPKGKVTRPGLLADALGTTARAVAKAICLYKWEKRVRVVLKGGKFPHPDNNDDCLKRAQFLESEGLKISDDKRRVIISEEDMWRPKFNS